MYRMEDTIGAVATPAGVGGIGIVRVSGEGALAIAGRIFLPHRAASLEGTPGGPLAPQRQFLFGRFKNPATGEFLDEGILLVMPGPHSYTAEDVVEFHVHGSPALLEKLMEVLVGLGVRPAEPGEFTYRAFSHGRLDLTQAEAVEALISAQGEAARRQALRQLTGGLAAHLEPLEESLKSLYLKIEARLEFSEDGIPPLDLPPFQAEVRRVQGELQKLLESYAQGKVIREGLAVALVGPPNVGKSSLLNALLGIQRAIVTPLAGTTRDVVEGEIRLKGVRVRLFDTAGIRDARNEVEVEGIRRSRQVIEEADAVFWVIDASDPEPSLKELKVGSLPLERTWFLFNKMDLVAVADPPAVLRRSGLEAGKCLALSCKTQAGLSQLVGKIENLLQTPVGAQDGLLTSLRHQQEARKAFQALAALEGLIRAHEPYELWTEELKEATLAVGRIRGRNLPAQAFEDIFSKFCIGK